MLVENCHANSSKPDPLNKTDSQKVDGALLQPLPAYESDAHVVYLHVLTTGNIFFRFRQDLSITAKILT